jgi:hypothetical protein
MVSDLAPAPVLTRNESGLELVESHFVEGLSGSIPARPQEAMTTVGVNRGDPAEGVQGVFADTITASMIEPTSCLVTVTYRSASTIGIGPGAPPIVEIGSSVQTADSNLDNLGNLITVEADVLLPDPNAEPGTTPSLVLITDVQSVTYQKQVPHMVARFRLTRYGSPKGDAQQFVGTVNVTSWYGGSARTWLCVAIDGTSNDGGETYECSYEFHYRRDTWDIDVVYIETRTGVPPQSAVAPNGRKTVQVYGYNNFSDLGLLS